MAAINQAAGRIQLEIERLDGGLNTKEAPSKIDVYSSPDCLNVAFDDQGAVRTRYGSQVFNTSTTAPGAFAIDGHASYNGTMIIWSGGSIYRASGTTFVTVATGQSQYAAGSPVAWVVYQNLLFSSDGTNGPWKYDGSTATPTFGNMGIAVPGAPTAASGLAGVAGVRAGTYYYQVAFVNTQVVEGQAGTISGGVTIASTATIGLTGIPTGTATQAINARKIYRASAIAGPWHYIDIINDNTTTTYTDSTSATTWAAGAVPVTDGTAPTPFTTIAAHRERLFFDDSSNRTLLRYTHYQTPFISEAANFIPLNKGDYSYITAIGVQDNLVSTFKQSQIFLTTLNDPSDDGTWQTVKCAANVGIVGARALVEIPEGILFMARSSAQSGLGNIAGLQLLSGTNVQETISGALRTNSISTRIDPDIFNFPSTYWSKIALAQYNGSFYMTCAISGDTANSHMYNFDLDRLQDEGFPGSWALWSGIAVNTLLVHNGLLYGGEGAATGQVIQLEVPDLYTDKGSAINSYWWSKEYGGGIPSDGRQTDASLESWIKDFRFVNLWYKLLGNWNMNLKYRLDGDTGAGTSTPISLNPGGSVWGSFIWGVNPWGSGRLNYESQHSLGLSLGRRIQIGVDNGTVAGAAFHVNALKVLMGLRRQR